jgi:hypothetical protein
MPHNLPATRHRCLQEQCHSLTQVTGPPHKPWTGILTPHTSLSRQRTLETITLPNSRYTSAFLLVWLVDTGSSDRFRFCNGSTVQGRDAEFSVIHDDTDSEEQQ